ncbi:MAG: ribosome-binding factor A [Puniceicoccales bacterium]|jgi:ribosome-binding factor A|nr:ribosome-binding factor A [Puniceicoccales bacterium]
MSQRTIRLDQLLLQEFSHELHTRWRSEAVRITLTGVNIADDLRQATIYFSVLGDDAVRAEAVKLLKRIRNPLKAEVFKRVQIKYTPALRFAHDDSSGRGAQLLNALDRVAQEDAVRDARNKPVEP